MCDKVISYKFNSHFSSVNVSKENGKKKIENFKNRSFNGGPIYYTFFIL